MKGLKSALLALCGLLVFSLAAQAEIMPWTVTVGGESVQVMPMMPMVDGEGNIVINDETYNAEDWDEVWMSQDVSGDGFLITECSSLQKYDPTLIFNFSITNTGVGSLPVNMMFPLTLVPSLDGIASIQSEIGITLTDGAGNGFNVNPLAAAHGVFDAPGTPDELMTVTLVDGSSNRQTGTVDLRTAFDENLGFVDGVNKFGDTFLTGGFDTGLISPDNDPWETLFVNLDFELSPGDAIGITGKVDINIIPIPGIMLLLGSGIIALVGMRKRD
jgi:hypothetical protein